jgi:thiopeptide-type bacteriocin biosynthesis protein
MGEAADKQGWRALHVFLDDSRKLTAFLTEQIGAAMPGLRPLASGWFFIRYWEGGQHIRLRLRGLESDTFDALRRRFSAAIEGYRSPDPIDRESYRAALSKSLIVTSAEEAEAFYDDGTVVELPYLPETDRYGGSHALLLNEALFAVSSDLALSLAARSSDTAAVRLAIARDLMLAGAAALDPDRNDLGAFFADYAAFWRSFSGPAGPDAAALRASGERSAAAVAKRLDGFGAASTDPFGSWYAAMKDLVAGHRRLGEQGRLAPAAAVNRPEDTEKTVRSIVGSQIHMLNNRLGTGPANEYAIAAILAGALHRPN